MILKETIMKRKKSVIYFLIAIGNEKETENAYEELMKNDLNSFGR